MKLLCKKQDAEKNKEDAENSFDVLYNNKNERDEIEKSK